MSTQRTPIDEDVNSPLNQAERAKRTDGGAKPLHEMTSDELRALVTEGTVAQADAAPSAQAAATATKLAGVLKDVPAIPTDRESQDKRAVDLWDLESVKHSSPFWR